MIVYAIPAIFIASMFACHAIAKSRGAKPVFWVVMGALFGPLAIPFAFFAKPA
jgi:hypothetical protein